MDRTSACGSFGCVHRFATGFFGDVDRLSGDLARDLFAAVERLFAGFRGGLLHLVGERPDPFVLDLRAR